MIENWHGRCNARRAACAARKSLWSIALGDVSPNRSEMRAIYRPTPCGSRARAVHRPPFFAKMTIKPAENCHFLNAGGPPYRGIPPRRWSGRRISPIGARRIEMLKSKSVGPPSAYSQTSVEEVCAIIDGVDHVAHEHERKWGVGRLRLLVDDDMRARFDRQRRLWNDAVWQGDLAQVRGQGAAMKRAWQALDAVATEAGGEPLVPDAWETRLSDGRVLVIVRTSAEAWAAQQENRAAVVWTLDEIARVLESDALNVANRVKQAFEGAEVERVESPRPFVEDDVVLA